MSTRSDSVISDMRRHVAATDTIQKLLGGLSNDRFEITGASVEARALMLATLAEETGRKLAVITPGDGMLADLASALRLFHSNGDRVFTYPNPSLSPYQEVPYSLAVVRDEIRTLGRLFSDGVDVLVIPSRALLQRLTRSEDFVPRIISVAIGDDLDTRSLLERLTEGGFVRSDLVGEMGEFAFRGGILDVFPPNSDQPLRIELFGDTVDSIRFFDTESQRSLEAVDRVEIFPMSQFSAGGPQRRTLAKRLSLDFQDPIYRRDLAEKVERLTEHGHFPGMESYLPVALPSISLGEYLGASDWLITAFEPDEVTTAIDRYETLLRTEYEAAVAKGKALYAPDVFLTPPPVVHDFLGRVRVAFSSVHISTREYREVRVHAPVAKRYVNRLTELSADLTAARGAGRKRAVFASTRGGCEKIERLLNQFEISFSTRPTHLADEVVILDGQLAQGFDFEEAGLLIASEWDLFEPPTSSRIGASRKRTSDAFLTELRDLKAGDYIVHVDHGVGKFVGLRRIPFGATEREVMELEYSNAGKLLMPMENLNLIQKYTGGTDTPPRLDRLGGTMWARTKATVKKAMRDMADELLKLYATRQMVSGYPFSPDTPWQRDFEDAFEFDETEDQLSAIGDIKDDMEAKRPMDRLLCGDVGYGKTEVAMRAAFKSVMDSKQVAVLAPTTILAYQHHRTFLRRFASFPVSIELLSRYWSSKEQKEIVRKVEAGEVDIIIGTHRILSKDLQFKDLGVLIIDEEQRFGVAQKERLKQLKKSVDVLAMSATPIPRTLHMSLVGIRDVSIIETPPKDRLAIQTAVVPYNDEFVREAIEFEVARNGQVFFVHNRVDSIYAMREHLERIIPGLRVAVGHGQMDERELEKTMMEFIRRDYDVLLSTTIIENGIDIPACNTILINHAERFGLSQLYQLRGRVGRSDRLAFCYLLVPADRVLSSDARKRLAAIQEFSDLGAGFRIAARDLEIRGSGNLLGGEQSGQIAAVGFEMYTKLLEETVRELKGEIVEDEVEPSINLGLDIYIPHDYVADENLRMMFYKKVASARDEQRLGDIRNEMRDRFGAIPENVEALFDFIRLKLTAKAIGVISIVRDGSIAALKFTPKAKIDPNRLLSLLSNEPAAKFTPAGVLSLPLKQKGRANIAEIEELLRGVSAPA